MKKKQEQPKPQMPEAQVISIVGRKKYDEQLKQKLYAEANKK